MNRVPRGEQELKRNQDAKENGCHLPWRPYPIAQMITTISPHTTRMPQKHLKQRFAGEPQRQRCDQVCIHQENLIEARQPPTPWRAGGASRPKSASAISSKPPQGSAMESAPKFLSPQNCQKKCCFGGIFGPKLVKKTNPSQNPISTKPHFLHCFAVAQFVQIPPWGFFLGL